jgi:uncharacterized protein (DUF1800 family)
MKLVNPSLSRRATLALGALALAAGVTPQPGSTPQAEAATQFEKPPKPRLATLALTRLSFGLRPTDLAAFDALPGQNEREKLMVWLDRQLNPASINDSALESRLQKLGYSAMQKPLAQAWQEHRLDVKDDDPKGYEKKVRPAWEVRLGKIVRAIYSERQLFEVVVDFWHNHFNTNPERHEGIATTYGSYDYEVIRKHALGNFRQLLEATATSPAMLYYLDNASSSRAGPNENYARELLELHTLGAEHYLGVKSQRDVPGFMQGQPQGYVDDDVYEVTRAFTGWRVNDNKDEAGLKNDGSFAFHQPSHDRFQKIVLGRFLPADQPPMKDGRDVLDALASHPGTARFICRKLCRRLLSDTPPESLVQRAARLFLEQQKAPDQIKQVLRLIVLSDEFAAIWGEKMRRPFEFVVASLRSLEAEVQKPENIYWWLDVMNNAPFNRLPPDGYGDEARHWANTSGMINRWRFIWVVANGWFEGVKVRPPAGMPFAPNDLVPYWTQRFFGRPLTPEATQDLVAYIAGDSDPSESATLGQLGNTLPTALALMLMSPDFQWR